MAEIVYRNDNFDSIDRAVARWLSINGAAKRGRLRMVMDLAAADGVNGNPPLDWPALLDADAWQFCHDVGGIFAHLDRSTGRLVDCFCPRFTKES